MKTSSPHSSPILFSALLGSLLVGLLAQGCASGGASGSQPVGSGGAASAGGTTGNGGSTGKTSTGGDGSGGAGSGGIGSGGASTGGSGAGSGGNVGTGGGGAGAGAGGTGTGGGGTGGSSASSAGAGGTGTGGGGGMGGSSASSTGAGGTGTGGSAGRSGAGGGSPAAGAGGSAGSGGMGGGGRGGSTGTGGAGSGGTMAFNPCPAAGTACAIMPLGDSITDGVGSSGGGYRVELFHKAVQAGKAITFVGSATDPNGPTTLDGKPFPRNHEGHGGYTIDNSATTSGISPLVDASIATNHPHIILLMIGTNDINRNIDPANAPTRLGALLDRTINDAPNALLVVAKITPWMDDGANASVVQPYNNAIAGVVQTRAASGKHVILVDMFAPFTANPNYKTALMNDYLHPKDAGYVIMGDTWYAAIQSYLPAAQ